MTHFTKFLFVNPPYEAIGVSESVSSMSVVLSLAMLAALCRKHRRDVEILDLNLHSDWQSTYRSKLSSFKPDVVGITFTTPTVFLARQLVQISRESGSTFVIGGGPHATALPLETLSECGFDAIAVGEAEFAFENFLLDSHADNIPGWVTPGMSTYGSGLIVQDLDSLPYAAVDLFDVERYVYPDRASRRNPVCLIETCRGCYARCTFCNKNIFGFKLRRKSPKRVVDEMEFILNCGYCEIHIADDLFTADLRHASAVCREIIKRRLIFPWVPRSGIRVDRISAPLLKIMAEAGCYHVPLGIESGNQQILDRIKKGITLDQVRQAVASIRAAGMETTGYFMVGMPGETQETIKQTLDFSTGLKLDFIKIGVCVPLPGTPMFSELEQAGRLRTRDWGRYTYATPHWELVQSDLTPDIFKQFTVSGIPLMEAANRTLIHEGGGVYGLD